MAAQPITRHSYSDPLETFATNVLGTLNILEAVRTENAKTIIVNVTTDKCYQNKNWVWPYRENDSLIGRIHIKLTKHAQISVTIILCSFSDNSALAAIATDERVMVGGGDTSDDNEKIF